ncbi:MULTISPECIES: FAD-binding protein [unclassified Adlercreutzia]|uniref:FAD-binding protein n=1 Tax=unclassified Adlercreutzia TaxID=2636013 RepID=UPI0013EB3B06|nr:MULTISPECIES: FAD-binding protein [unclassified Adlercreutzia]
MTLELNRRTFLKGMAAAGVASAGVLAAGCAPTAGSTSSEGESTGTGSSEEARYSFEVVPEPIPEEEIVETIDCEILIVGAGIAGNAAAARASELCDDVRVIEAGSGYGSSRSSTTGYNTKYQRALGLEFNDEIRDQLILDAYMLSGRYQSRIDLISIYVDHSGEMLDWAGGIMEDFGGAQVTYAAPFSQTGDKLAAGTLLVTGDKSNITNYYNLFELSHNFVGPDPHEKFEWNAVMGDYAASNGAVFDFNTKGVRIERSEEEDRPVTGVIATNKDGAYVRYNASKGIIIAAGDYMRDPEMLQKYCPLALNNYYDFSAPQCDGAMAKAAMWIGAGFDTMATLDAWPGQTITGKIMRPDPAKEENPELAALWAMSDAWSWNPAVASYPMLYVTKQGERFTNEETENITGCMRMANCLASVPPEGFAWSIWDGAWFEKYGDILAPITAFSINTQEQIDNVDVPNGLTFKADTIEELAEMVEIPYEDLKATIDTYNAMCESGHDDLFLKQAKWCKPIDTPPFYAAGIGMGIECVRGGLTMDGKLRITDTEGKPIPHLYAVGNSGGSFYGNIYPSMIGGTGTGHGMTFGMLAAEEIMGQSRLG